MATPLELLSTVLIEKQEECLALRTQLTAVQRQLAAHQAQDDEAAAAEAAES